MANIIIKGKTNMGKTRSEQEENLRKDWGSTMNDEQLSKLKHAEKKAKEQMGSKENFFRLVDVDKVK